MEDVRGILISTFWMTVMLLSAFCVAALVGIVPPLVIQAITGSETAWWIATAVLIFPMFAVGLRTLFYLIENGPWKWWEL